MICNDSNHNGLLYAKFNQDYGCFACGMCKGFRIYNTEPLKEKERQDFPGMGVRGGVKLIEMLFRCNYVALAFADHPHYQPNKAVIWDDIKKKIVIELEFASEVVAIRLRRDKIVVVLDSAVKVFTFAQPPSLLHIFETCENAAGLVSLCPASDRALLAMPARVHGRVRLADLAHADKQDNPLEFAAHEGRLVAMEINLQGTLLATASEKGTLIRVFLIGGDFSTKPQQLHELRRGTQAAHIYCIAFSDDSSMLCCASDHGTVHVFPLQRLEQSGSHSSSSSSSSSSVGRLNKYLSQVTSVARISIPQHVPALCAFSQDCARPADCKALIVITAAGDYMKYSLSSSSSNGDRQQGCRQVYTHFLDMTRDDA